MVLRQNIVSRFIVFKTKYCVKLYFLITMKNLQILIIYIIILFAEQNYYHFSITPKIVLKMNLLFFYSAVFLLEGIDNITEIHDIKKKFSWITQITN